MRFVKRSGLLHRLRLLIDPEAGGLIKNKGAWRVYYPPNNLDPHGGFSIRKSYGDACAYAEMFDGEVVRASEFKGGGV